MMEPLFRWRKVVGAGRWWGGDLRGPTGQAGIV